jgi:hypothetical protein
MKIQSVKHFEFRGGYCLAPENELIAVIKAYRDGDLKKDGLRVFAAGLEKRVLHEKSRVDISRILNCRSKQKGIKRLRMGLIKKANEAIEAARKSAPCDKARLKSVPRVALRAIAQGRLTCTEAVVFLMYSLRRISQRKTLKRLLPEERYARFTYRELSEVSGIPKANISRAVSALKEKGFLGTVWVVKQNENQFGLLFVDGPLLSLIPGAAADRSRPEHKKTTTPRAEINNTSLFKLPTLKNSYPKTSNEKIKADSFCKGSRGRGSEWDRILKRANAMKENLAEQAA